MAVNTLDELDSSAYDRAEKAIRQFRKANKTRREQDILYEKLTNLGLTSESADEYINLEMEE